MRGLTALNLFEMAVPPKQNNFNKFFLSWRIGMQSRPSSKWYGKSCMTHTQVEMLVPLQFATNNTEECPGRPKERCRSLWAIHVEVNIIISRQTMFTCTFLAQTEPQLCLGFTACVTLNPKWLTIACRKHCSSKQYFLISGFTLSSWMSCPLYKRDCCPDLQSTSSATFLVVLFYSFRTAIVYSSFDIATVYS